MLLSPLWLFLTIVTIASVVLALLSIAWAGEIFSLVIGIGLVLYAAFYYPRAVYLYIILLTAALRLISVAIRGKNLAQSLVICPAPLGAGSVDGRDDFLPGRRAQAQRPGPGRARGSLPPVCHSLPGCHLSVRVNQSQPDFLHGPFFELTGYDIEDFRSGKLIWMDVVHPEDREARREQQQRLLEQPGSQDTMIYRIQQKSGRIRWVQEQMQILPDPSGKSPYPPGRDDRHHRPPARPSSSCAPAKSASACCSPVCRRALPWWSLCGMQVMRLSITAS